MDTKRNKSARYALMAGVQVKDDKTRTGAWPALPPRRMPRNGHGRGMRPLLPSPRPPASLRAQRCSVEKSLCSGVIPRLFLEEKGLCCYNNLAAALLDRSVSLNHLRKISCHNNTEQFFKQSNTGLGFFSLLASCNPQDKLLSFCQINK